MTKVRARSGQLEAGSGELKQDGDEQMTSWIWIIHEQPQPARTCYTTLVRHRVTD